RDVAPVGGIAGPGPALSESSKEDIPMHDFSTSGRRFPRAASALLMSVIVAGTLGLFPGVSGASSHREAPLISSDPQADNTDLYAFVSPDKPDTATIISNWIPGEDPAAGPNYYTFSE